jgi:hypothetical protein
MLIFFRTLPNKSIGIDIDYSDTVEDVYAKIENIGINRPVMIFFGRMILRNLDCFITTYNPQRQGPIIILSRKELPSLYELSRDVVMKNNLLKN